MADADAIDEADIRGALGSIGLSAALILGGTVVSQFLGLVTRIVMTRYLSVGNYGAVALGITVLNVMGVVALVGMEEALPRFLPRAEDDADERAILGAVYQICFALAIAIGVVGIVGANLLATRVFDAPSLTGVVRIFGFVLPFYVAYRLGVRGVQGYGRTTPTVLVRNVVEPTSRLLAVVGLVALGLGTFGVAVGYAAGFVVAGIAGFLVLQRTAPFGLRDLLRVDVGGRRRELLTFALPLAVTGGFGLIAQQSDVVVLGVLTTSEDVGVYDVAFLAAKFLMVVTPAINYLFQPLVSEYEKEGEFGKIAKLYTITTRWIVVLAFPVFALLFLFPEVMLSTVFGSAYGRGGTTLAILVLGFYVGRFSGLSGSLLAAMGKTRVIMYVSVGAEILNIVLNVVLIALFGLVGAAVATATSRILNNFVQTVYIYRETGLHPYRRTFVAPTALTMATVVAVAVTLHVLRIDLGIAAALGVTAVLGLVAVGYVLATRSVYETEVAIVRSLLENLGLPTWPATVLERFTR